MDQYRNASSSHLKFACNGLITFNFFFMKLSKKKLELHPKLQKGKKISLADKNHTFGMKKNPTSLQI